MPKINERLDLIKSDFLNHLFGKSKRFKPILDYVNKDNKNDRAIAKLKKEGKEVKEILKRLEDVAHPPFFTSEEKANMFERIEKLEKTKADKSTIL